MIEHTATSGCFKDYDCDLCAVKKEQEEHPLNLCSNCDDFGRGTKPDPDCEWCNDR